MKQPLTSLDRRKSKRGGDNTMPWRLLQIEGAASCFDHTIWRRYVSALGTILNIFNARWCSSQTYSTLPSRSGIHTKAASRIKNEVGLIWLRRQSAVLRAIICTFRTLNVLRCMSTLIIITWATIRCKEFGGEINGSNCESSPESPEHTQQ
mmetsp:Transcript_18005/g.44096  ORF Transcript_18005/g.44096 Transcript_18005/m.44096 type:complete len:151 (-) Transcript_18005:1027-1479(-)